MKRYLILSILLLSAAFAGAVTTATTTPGSWALYVGSTKATTHATEVACVSAAKALSVTRNYTCRTSTGVSVVVTADPPPVVVVPPVVTPPIAGALQLSPAGADAGDCQASPCKTFSYAFARLPSGGELVLMDGTYASALSWTGPAGSAQIPSGTAGKPTVVRAANPGKVVVPGLFLGRSTRKDSYITVQGITFEGGATLYNTSFVTLKDVGVHGPLGIGTNDHAQGNTDNLIEDVWVWAAEQRGIAMNYRAHRNVWRRVVIRGDGCANAGCMGDGNPNIGITVYDSHDVSLQNVIVVDRVLSAGAGYYADFASAQHTADAQYWFGRNEWLGTLSINAPDAGYYIEPDLGQTVDPTVRMENVAAINSAGGGFNLARAGTNNVLNNVLAKTLNGDAVRVAPEMTSGSLSNVIAIGRGRYAINSAYPTNRAAISGAWSEGASNQRMPAVIFSGDPLASGLKYPVRIEAGSALASAGFALDITKRIGADGSRMGEAGYNALTSAALWPWPNEARIKAEMCAAVKRGFCADGKQLDGVRGITFTSYVIESLGSPNPY